MCKLATQSFFMKIILRYCKLNTFIFVIIILCTQNFLFSQESGDKTSKTTIDSAMAFSPNYMPVEVAKVEPLFYNMLIFRPIDTGIVLSHRFEPLFKTENLFQSLGIGGQAHQSVNFDFEREIGFSYINLPFPLYFKKQKDLQFYRLQTSYTRINYTLGIPSENTFSAIHAQKIRNFNIVVNLWGYMNEGYFAHQKNGNVVGDFLMHYELPSKIYGFRFSYIINRFNIQENGGLQLMNDFKDGLSPNLQGYNMNLYYAHSKLLTHDMLLHNYVNLFTKFKKKEKKQVYLGTISHTIQFKHSFIHYRDEQPDSTYYRSNFYISSDSTSDSLRFFNIINTLQWSSYQPYSEVSKKNYFIHFAGGLRHEYTESFKKDFIGNSFTLFGQTHIRLFSVMDIYAQLAYSFTGYNHNDAQANIKIEWAINREKQHFLGLRNNLYRVSPDYLYKFCDFNHNQWDTSFNKQNILKLSTFWKLRNYKISFNYFLLKNYTQLNSEFMPFATDNYANILQLNLFFPIYVKGFGFEFNGWGQYSDNKYVPLPLFAGKSSIFYVVKLFQKKMQLQVGTDLAYNTRYEANGYFPVLHQFYFREGVQVGNYFYLDLFLNVKVQRLNFYFRLGHVLAGVMGNDYFTTPNYPMQGRSYAIGINWRFYD